MTIKIIIIIAFCVAVNLIITFVRKRIKGLSTTRRWYLLQLLRLVVIMFCCAQVIEEINPEMNIQSVLLKGSALVVAILGFAAQPVISDIICGLLISIHKPFEIGDRIIVEGQQPAVVEDLTLGHTVLRIYDDQRIIVPNSEMNSKILTNTGYRMKDRRGLHLEFKVSFDTDVRRAMEIIRDCVVDSPYALVVETNGIREDSGPVYFLRYGDSAVILETTIWVTKETNNYKAMTDVNLRVHEAFRKYGIEIPYPYFNIVEFEGDKTVPAAIPSEKESSLPVKRHRRTNTIHMEPGQNRLEEAVGIARSFAKNQKMDRHAAMQLELLMEESLGFIQRVAEQTKRDCWIEGTGVSYRIHVLFMAKVGSEEYKKLLEVSSSGRNEAANGFSGRIWAAIFMGLMSSPTDKGSRGGYEWQLSDADISEEEIGKSILGALASNIRVSVTSEKVELIVSKS